MISLQQQCTEECFIEQKLSTQTFDIAGSALGDWASVTFNIIGDFDFSFSTSFDNGSLFLDILSDTTLVKNNGANVSEPPIWILLLFSILLLMQKNRNKQLGAD